MLWWMQTIYTVPIEVKLIYLVFGRLDKWCEIEVEQVVFGQGFFWHPWNWRWVQMLLIILRGISSILEVEEDMEEKTGNSMIFVALYDCVQR